MEIRKAGDKLQSFIQNDGGKWQQSPELKTVLGIMQDNTDKQINIEVAPSPMILGEQPAWGSGNGAYNPKTGRAFVDPMSHPTVGAQRSSTSNVSPHATKHSFNKIYRNESTIK